MTAFICNFKNAGNAYETCCVFRLYEDCKHVVYNSFGDICVVLNVKFCNAVNDQFSNWKIIFTVAHFWDQKFLWFLPFFPHPLSF
jgi:hypothetical protein